MVPACWNCHTLKDRVPFEDWKEDARDRAIRDWVAFRPAPGPARILQAKILTIFFEDLDRERASVESFLAWSMAERFTDGGGV